MNKLLFILFTFTLTTFADTPIEGIIPRYYSIEAASDLLLSPEIAHQQALAGDDISLIEPRVDSNIYNPNHSEITHSNLITESEVEYSSLLSSRLGIVRFNIKNSNDEFVTLYLSKKVHSFLLRKNILEKLGYTIPQMNWVPQLKVNFPSTIDKTLFVEEMKDQLLADTERWIIDETDTSVTLIDLVALEANSNLYNLSLGIMNQSIHRGRRLLRAPYVPLAMVDTLESVNLFAWRAGRVVLDHINLDHSNDLSRGYGTSFEDGRWITRKIAHLSREDIEEVVEKAYYPDSVRLLLVEKITERRNSLVNLFKLEDEFAAMPFNPEVSDGVALFNGEIVQEFFEGYVSRYSFGDPESPFSSSEIGSYLFMKLQSEAFKLATRRLNRLLQNDTEALFEDRILDIIDRDGLFYPIQAVVVPSVRGQLILSREVVAGQYLGIDNRVQLVDNIGFALDMGAVGSVEGLDLPVPLGVTGGTGVAFQRIYSHVKPITSMRSTLREPYKNMLVPLLIAGIARNINGLDGLEGEELQRQIQLISTQLKESLAVGESFIVTDSIVPYLTAGLNLSFSSMMGLDANALRLYADMTKNGIKISRFHIHRKDENTIQIYKDKGEGFQLEFSLRLKAYVNILKMKARWTRARAKTEYFPINLRSSELSVELLKNLRHAMMTTSVKRLRRSHPPYVVEHKVANFFTGLNFLTFKRNRFRGSHLFTVNHPNDRDKVTIERRYDAITKGRDVENFAVESFNNLMADLTEVDFDLSTSPVLNPGFTIYGRAKNKIFTSEKMGDEVHTHYQRVINGWRANRRQIRRYFYKLNNEFGFNLFNTRHYQSTNSILLYQFALETVIHNDGVQKLLNSSLNDYFTKLSGHYTSGVRERKRPLNRRLYRRQQEAKHCFENEGENCLRKWHRYLKSLFNAVDIQGVKALAGDYNVVTYGRVDGFRNGDEAGDTPIVSDVLGQLPVALHPSFTQQMQATIGILPGELTVKWLSERAL